MRALLSPSRACGGTTGQARRGPAHPKRRGGAMQARTLRLSPLALAVAALLCLTGQARPAGATSQTAIVRFDAFGADAGGEPRVKVYQSAGNEVASFLAFNPAFTGGVRVAVG